LPSVVTHQQSLPLPRHRRRRQQMWWISGGRHMAPMTSPRESTGHVLVVGNHLRSHLPGVPALTLKAYLAGPGTRTNFLPQSWTAALSPHVVEAAPRMARFLVMIGNRWRSHPREVPAAIWVWCPPKNCLQAALSLHVSQAPHRMVLVVGNRSRLTAPEAPAAISVLCSQGSGKNRLQAAPRVEEGAGVSRSGIQSQTARPQPP